MFEAAGCCSGFAIGVKGFRAILAMKAKAPCLQAHPDHGILVGVYQNDGPFLDPYNNTTSKI